MKLSMIFKDPDAVHIALKREGLDSDKAGSDGDEIYRAVSKWIKWGEYVRIEVDTEAGTATVLPFE